MKAKTMLGLIACASACVSLSAFANVTNDWFVADASVDPALVNVATGGTVTVENQKFVLDSESPLTFTPDVLLTATNSTNIARIDVRAVLTPSLTNEFQQTVGEAKAGFAVGIDAESNTNFYGYVAGGGWAKFNDGTPRQDDAETSFSIVLNYRDGEAHFMVDDVEIGSRSFAAGGTLNRLEAFGAGSISSITSGFEVAVAAAVTASGATTNMYGSAVEALAKVSQAGDGSVQDIDVTTGQAAAAPQAANGLWVWECDALGIPGDVKIPFEPATTVDGAITLRVASTIEPGIDAQFKVSNNGGSTWSTSYPADAIKVPMAQGSYLIVPAEFSVK